MKPTVILGASSNPDRYSFLATEKLARYGHDVYPIGIRSGNINGISIITDRPELKNVDTITVYLSALNQKDWYNYILSLNPKRIIFNPGAENPELEQLATEKGINVVNACTLVMLSIGNY